MHITGIITEYNPFHNGHLYQIEQIKKKYPNGYIVIVMSGNFAQRGIPCITDKFTRAEMALASGVDMVLELPVVYATASAERFAQAAVNILHQSGIVDTICFGSETPYLKEMVLLAELLLEEPTELSHSIKSFLAQGESYPRARLYALINYIRDTQKTISLSSDALTELLTQPNNILSIEYLKALKLYNTSIEPFAIERKTSHYHDINIDHTIASATAIRHQVALKDFDKITYAMPSSAFNLLKPTLQNPVALDHFSSIFHYKMIMSELEDLYAIWDAPKNLCHSLYHAAHTFTNLSALIDEVTSKTYSRATVQRTIMHLLLEIKTTDMLNLENVNWIPYIRVLSCKKTSRNLLAHLYTNANVPVITGLGKSISHLNPLSKTLLSYDLKASKLYGLLSNNPSLTHKDFTYHPFKS